MTVKDVKRYVTQEELNGWVSYVEKNGPLNPMLRLEGALARSTAHFLKDVKPAALMVWPRKEEPVATAESVFGLLRGLARSK